MINGLGQSLNLANIKQKFINTDSWTGGGDIRVKWFRNMIDSKLWGKKDHRTDYDPPW